jgi:hypothetical protein
MRGGGEGEGEGLRRLFLVGSPGRKEGASNEACPRGKAYLELALALDRKGNIYLKERGLR